MAYQYTTRYLDGSAFYGRAVRWTFEAIDAAIAWNDARVTRKALGNLTDRELDDLGLCRGDIERVALYGRRR